MSLSPTTACTTIVGDVSADNLDALLASVVAKPTGRLSRLRSRAVLRRPARRRRSRCGSASRGRAHPSVAAAERICDLSLRPLTDAAGIVAGAVGCLSDVTDRVQLRRELEVRASVDRLTSCLNRDASLQLLERTTAAPKAPGEGNALIYIDLDDFKSVNDRYGHAAGDRLLAEAAERLREAARKGDAVGRVGGDEFIVICPHVQSSAQAIKVAERVAAATTAMRRYRRDRDRAAHERRASPGPLRRSTPTPSWPRRTRPCTSRREPPARA